MLLVIWLCVEYYEKRFFFQSGFAPYHRLFLLLRTLFALFFYSSFIIGLATIIWWHGNRIKFYPIIEIIGLALFVYSIVVRRKIFMNKEITVKSISDFYYSMLFLTTSLALVYSSIFSIPYAVVIGFPLILLQKRYEISSFKQFETYVHQKEKIEKIKTKKYNGLLHKYIEHQSKKTRKRNQK